MSEPDGGEMLRAYLAERDEACPSCGYNLRGLLGGACPECGRRLRLQVGLVEPRLAWFVTGVVGLSMGIGFGVLLLMIIVFFQPTRELIGCWPFAATAALNGTLLWAWVLGRRRMGRCGGALRWMLALGGVALSIFLAWVCYRLVK